MAGKKPPTDAQDASVVAPAKRGPKPYAPSDDERTLVGLMVQAGVTQDQISSVLQISKPTLNKYFRAELDNASTHLLSKAFGRLVEKAMTDDNPTWLLFLLKTRFNFRDTTRQELTGADGSPLITTVPDIHVNFKSPTAPGGTES
jgi:hypothetical protein